MDEPANPGSAACYGSMCSSQNLRILAVDGLCVLAHAPGIAIGTGLASSTRVGIVYEHGNRFRFRRESCL